ncbi:MAG: adenylosuccinate synthetase [Prevotella sp.]|nr:adenylosuccinate synthetase [Prevotella sp.]
MRRARIIIGSNYGDEGKGTVTARYARDASHALNVLTNGGPQRGHSILSDMGEGRMVGHTFQHFGSGSYHGADNYYSRFFILNPMQFVKEYESLMVKPLVYRDKRCRWTTPYDSMANLIVEQQRKRHCSCCMGIWNTIKRYKEMPAVPFDVFLASTRESQLAYLCSVKNYYEKGLDVPTSWKDVWNSPVLVEHFLWDCAFMAAHTTVCELSQLNHDELIFENGQGLLLCDTGKDTPDTTPSHTGARYALELLKEIPDVDVTAHYVTRPYLTRHGDGGLEGESDRSYISTAIAEDRTNHYNEGQGEFRYGALDIERLRDRVRDDANGLRFELEVTHCDEMDRVEEFKKWFDIVNTYDSPLT